jgi:hypothetical protein
MSAKKRSMKMDGGGKDVAGGIDIVRCAPSRSMIDGFLAEAKRAWKEEKHHTYVAIDLEFTRGRFALIQLCFDMRNERKVFLSNKPFKGLRELLISRWPLKLLHGSESNDVPWLLQQLSEEERPLLFRNMIDTRFIAEYIDPGQRPGLYDVLRRFDILQDTDVERLLAVEKSMGRVQHVDWRLDRIKDAATEYAIHDVIHLKALYIAMRKRDQTVVQFRNLLRVTFLERFLGVLNHEELDRANVYHLSESGKTMYAVFSRLLDTSVFPHVDIKRVMQVSWMKYPVQTFIRRLVYHLLTCNYEVMADKKTVFSKTISTKLHGITPWTSLKSLMQEFELIIKYGLETAIEMADNGDVMKPRRKKEAKVKELSEVVDV